jgi:hypothetical protein
VNRIKSTLARLGIRNFKPTLRKACITATLPAVSKAAAAPRPRRPRTRAEQPAVGKRTSSTLSDQVLAFANGKTQQEIAAACKGARPNHVGAAIARYKRAGRIEERDGKLYATQPTEMVQHTAM